ncbi:AAA family ATPase [Mollicutes bacterium LVI A0078]|nr:AAA family ATPase [Mollicutes bacterium LVI A0075]WOO90236.1 AAA family ATPase [Mollicutes bacterium LVI A0078]
MEDKLKNLNKFAINITDLAREQKLDPIIGRDDEIRNVIRILSRKSKNNPVLIGEPGVGKTAIVEGLANRIISGDIPDHLRNKEIYSLDLGGIVAGAKFQGEFEERLKDIMKEVSENQDKVILFIDEIHMLIGMGKTSGAMDGANLLKPMLARGELSCIGATTLSEYKENIEKDAAFERRFQKVLVNEPSFDEALSILRGLKFNLEAYHGVRIEDEALVAAVKTSSRYITERFLPDKAIDLVDEAAANINVQLNSQPEELEAISREVLKLEIEKKALKGSKKNKERYNQVSEQLRRVKTEFDVLNDKWQLEKESALKVKELKDKLRSARNQLNIAMQNLEYEKAARLEYETIPGLERELEVAKAVEVNSKMVSDNVTPESIYAIISKITNIPVESLKTETKDKLLTLESSINEQVVGQEDAAKQITNSIIRSRMNIGNPNRPIGSFLFMGPTGVGKTEVCKVLADMLFNKRESICRIDMSEYMEKHSVSRLIGAPPGYVGFEEGGKLTEYVRTNPYSIVLFDEIEKAHPDVLNVLLQVLDDGRLTDSKGKTVNFKNTIIVMTSNIGSNLMLEQGKLESEQLLNLLKDYLKPEFINRIDSIIGFNSMSDEMYKQIVKLTLEELKTRLVENEITIDYDQDVIDYVYENSYNPEFGARPIKRFVQDHIETAIAYQMLREDSRNLTIKISENELNII